MFYLSLLLLLSAALSFGAPVDPAVRNALVVHEWGTFTSLAGADGLAVPWLPLSGPDDLPCFVKRTPVFNKLSLAGRIRMETPVLYFYSERPAQVSVDVRFPHGLITEWYPDARVTPKDPKGIPERHESPGGRIEWPSVQVRASRSAGEAEPRFPVEPGASHYYAARNTDANPVAVEIEGGANAQQDRFLFYRGAGSFDAPVAVTATTDNTVRIRSVTASGAGVPALILFENREGRIGYRLQGPLNGEVTLRRPKPDASVGDVISVLRDWLVRHGLFAKEAQAMIDTWRDSWFEEGSRLLYIVPPETVEAELPLSIVPRPAKTVRVFVGRAEFFTPDMADTVTAALKARDAGALARYGRFAAPQIESLWRGLAEPERRFASAGVLRQGPAHSNRCGEYAKD